MFLHDFKDAFLPQSNTLKSASTAHKN